MEVQKGHEVTKPMAIIAVDPGKRTGVAEWVQKTPNHARVEFASYEFDTADFYDYIHDRIHALVGLGYEIRFVVESFIITMHTAKNTQAPWSLELIGVCRFLAHRYHVSHFTMQAPNIGKTFGTNGKLKYLEWYRTGVIGGMRYAGHANDASRHLATYAAQRGLIFSQDQLVEMARL
jgi:hypothetical protein